MALSTKERKKSVSKTIEPGNHIVKINKIELYQPSFLEQDKGYYLRMEVESEPIKDENFEGFLIDKDDEKKGRHEGQVGMVDFSKFPYKWKSSKGKELDRDQMLVDSLNVICNALDSDWMPKHDGKFETIEQLVATLNKDKPFKDKWVYMCIGGKARLTTEGYLRYNMFLPENKNCIVSLRNKEQCVNFDKNVHVQSAGGTIPVADPSAADAFNQDVPTDVSMSVAPPTTVETTGGNDTFGDLPF